MSVWSRSNTRVLRTRPSRPGRGGGSSGPRDRRATLEMCGRLERKFKYSAASSACQVSAQRDQLAAWPHQQLTHPRLFGDSAPLTPSDPPWHGTLRYPILHTWTQLRDVDAL